MADTERLVRALSAITHDEMRALWDVTERLLKAANERDAKRNPDDTTADPEVTFAFTVEAVREKLAVAREAATGEYLSYPTTGGVIVRQGRQ